jgi:hypothetical protein
LTDFDEQQAQNQLRNRFGDIFLHLDSARPHRTLQPLSSLPKKY